jgi:hypothetical protein
MSSSWGHTIRALTADEVERSKRLGYAKCAAGKCREQRRYVTTYKYVTGRAGRVSSAQRELCGDHAAKFCRKHGLEFPGAEPTGQRAAKNGPDQIGNEREEVNGG